MAKVAFASDGESVVLGSDGEPAEEGVFAGEPADAVPPHAAISAQHTAMHAAPAADLARLAGV